MRTSRLAAIALSLWPLTACNGSGCGPSSSGLATGVDRIGARSGEGPAMMAADDKLYVAFRGYRQDDFLSWTSFDGSAWSPQEVLGPGVISVKSPALAVLGHRPYAAWRGASENKNVWYASLDGDSWTTLRVIPGLTTEA